MRNKPETTENQGDYKDLNDKYGEYSSNYSDDNFNQKLENEGHKFGGKLLSYSKFLYYLVTDKESPVDTKLKSIIYGALGYLILPIDLIPDFLPIGFTDDLAAIAAVVAATMNFAKKFKDDPVKLAAFNAIRKKAGLDPLTLNE